MIYSYKNLQVGSKWRHKNGNLYTILMFANLDTDEARLDEYPPTIIYQDEKGHVWCRSFSRWHSSMTIVD